MKSFAVEITELEAGDLPIREVRLCGRIDAQAVNACEREIEALLALPPGRFILNLAELDYISSAGIGMLMLLFQQVRRRGGGVVVLGPPPRIARVFEIMGLGRIFTIVQDRDAAREALGGNV